MENLVCTKLRPQFETTPHLNLLVPKYTLKSVNLHSKNKDKHTNTKYNFPQVMKKIPGNCPWCNTITDVQYKRMKEQTAIYAIAA